METQVVAKCKNLTTQQMFQILYYQFKFLKNNFELVLLPQYWHYRRDDIIINNTEWAAKK
jgi:hypothetical protein